MKTCIMIFGRFNPIHIGHGLMFNTGMIINKQIPNSDLKIYTTDTHDIKNPLPYEFKLQMISDYFPMCTQYVQTEHSGTLFEVLQDLNEEYDNLYMLCGSDRYNQYNEILNKYNNVLYNYANITVLSVGDDRSVSPYSSTIMRDAAIRGDFSTFNSCLPPGDNILNQIYFAKVQKFMECMS